MSIIHVVDHPLVAHKLTIMKRPHITIDMLKRNREKPFPKVFFRLMGLNKVKDKN